MPKGHGSSEVSEGRIKRIIGDLRLDKDEFHDLYRCAMRGPQYKDKIRRLIASREL